MRITSAPLAGIATLALASSASSAEPAATPVKVANPEFVTPWPGIQPGSPVRTDATCGKAPEVGASASADWTTFGNDRFASVTSWLTTA